MRVRRRSFGSEKTLYVDACAMFPQHGSSVDVVERNGLVILSLVYISEGGRASHSGES